MEEVEKKVRESESKARREPKKRIENVSVSVLFSRGMRWFSPIHRVLVVLFA